MIRVSPFLGELPKVSERLIPDAHATQATDCDLESASLRPALGYGLATTVTAGSQSVYRHPQGAWFEWAAPAVNMVKSPLNDDVWERVYWTGDGPPKMAPYADAVGTGTNPAVSYRLGLPAPATAPVAVGPTGEAPEGGVEVDTVYTVAYISAYGEEGPPSLPSNQVARWNGATVALSNLASAPSGNYNVVSLRIYRAESQGTYLFVADIPVANNTYNDSVPTEALGEPLASIGWDMPDARMKGLLNAGNGILCGWFENTLCFCEPYRPHAWPVGFQMGFGSNIVGVAPVGNGLVVVTEYGPWLVTGASPAAMSQGKLDVHLGGVSRLSVVDMGDYAIYASAEGLVAAGGGQASVITESMLTKAQWQAYNPETLHAYRWHDRYLAFYTRDNGSAGVMMLHPEQGLIHFEATGVTGGWLDPTTGIVYLVKSNGEVMGWQDGTPGSYTWTSKVFTLPRLQSLSVLKLDGLQELSDPVTVTVWADGNVLHTQSLTNEKAIRLPPGRYRNWQFQLTGQAEIFSVQLAPSPAELL